MLPVNNSIVVSRPDVMSGTVTRAWYRMEWKFRYGIWKMPEWNGMEDFKNGMEDNLPYFHTNSILEFVHCIYRKIHTDVG